MEFKSKGLVSRMQEMGIEREDPAMVLADAQLDESYRGQPLREAQPAPSAPLAADTDVTADAAEIAPAAAAEVVPVADPADVAAPSGADATPVTSDVVAEAAGASTTGEAEPVEGERAEVKAEEEKPEDEKPEGEIVPAAELSDIEKLVGMMNGTIKVAASANPIASVKKAVAPASPKVAEQEVDDLANLVANLPAESAGSEKPSLRSASPKSAPVVPAQGLLDKQSLRAERAQVEAGGNRAVQHQGMPLAGAGAAAVQGAPQTAVGSASTNLGNMLGQAAAGAVALPFIALTSAARHLQSKVANAKTMHAVPAASSAPADSFAAKFAMPLSVANTLEAITDWKMGRIEASSKAAQLAAQALSNTEEFVVWEDKMRNTADALGVPPQSVVSALGTDERYAELKTEMDAIWTANGDKVEAYRAACNDFERNVLNVVKEYPNSDKEIKGRVNAAITGVSEKTESMPGFGKEIGDYDQRTMMERIAELAKMIAKFVANLVAKMTGKSSSELSL